MKKTKLIIPILASLLNFSHLQNSIDYNKNFINYSVNELNLKKKEYYESVIRSFFPKMDSIKYTKDLDTWGIGEFWQTPAETDSLKKGDCEDKAFLIYSLLRDRGIDVSLIWGKMDTAHNIGHFWNEYKIGNSRYIIETASKKSRIIKEDTLDSRKRYVRFFLDNHKNNLIRDFEDYSGLELELKNPVRY